MHEYIEIERRFWHEDMMDGFCFDALDWRISFRALCRRKIQATKKSF
jgi:hypothetical protein